MGVSMYFQGGLIEERRAILSVGGIIQSVDWEPKTGSPRQSKKGESQISLSIRPDLIQLQVTPPPLNKLSRPNFPA